MEKSDLVFNATSHTYTYKGKVVPSVSQILLDEGFIDTTFFTDGGRDRGKMVHKAIEIQCKGAHCMDSKALEPYLEAWKNFRRDCEWVPEFIEVPMGCQYYAGTPDQIGWFRDSLTVLDIKTGSISAATGLQLAAYEKLYLEYAIEMGKGHPIKKPVMKRFAIQLTDTGRYILTEFKERNDRLIWDSAVAIWHFKRNNKIGGRR